MTAVGGIGSLPGAILGAFIIVLLPEYLRAVHDWRLVIYGVILIILMGLGRGGITGIISAILRQLLAVIENGRRLIFERGVR
jgi:branched-chain amino acid transport system permease protein